MRPQFIAAGTKLYAAGSPGDNATLTCEAFGGLSKAGGLKLTLLRGSGLKELADYANKWGNNKANSDESNATSSSPTPPSTVSSSSTGSSTSISYFDGRGGFLRNDEMEGEKLLNGAQNAQRFGNNIEVIKPGMDPRYELTAGPDLKNPYAAQIKLTIYSMFFLDAHSFVSRIILI